MAENKSDGDLEQQLQALEEMIAAHEKMREILPHLRRATVEERLTFLETQVHAVQSAILQHTKLNFMLVTKAVLEFKVENTRREYLEILKVFSQARTIGRA